MQQDGKLKGQMTIVAALSITIVISVVVACVNSVYTMIYKTQIKQACALSSEAIFAGYKNDVLDEFNIFLLEKNSNLNQQLSNYINMNVESFSQDITLEKAGFNKYNYATDYGGVLFEEEILEYMKYGVYSDIVNEIMDSEGQVKKATAVNEVVDGIVECDDYLFEMEAASLELVKLVEGINTTENGFVVGSNGPEAVEDYYVKVFANKEISMSTVNVSNQEVYDAMLNASYKYTNVTEIFDDMLENIDDLYEIGDEASEENGNMSYKSIYNRNYETIITVTVNSRNKMVEALNAIYRFETAKTGVEKKLSECEQTINDNRDYLDEDLISGFTEDLTDIKNETTSKRELCDIDQIKRGLTYNRNILNNLIVSMYELNTDLTQDICIEEKEKLLESKKLAKSFSSNALVFNYENVDFTSKSEGLELLRRLRDTIKDGICRLVTDEGEVSSKEVTYQDLAIGFGSGSDYEIDFDTLLYNEYLISKFPNYVDVKDEEETNKQLDYVLEFIIGGELSDKDNLNNVILEISAIREGLNLAYLITNTEKKNEAYALAATFLGFTGNTAIIKAGQYIIMTAWAYGEAILDIKKLLKGEKVELVKNSSNWELTIQNMLLFNFDSDGNESKIGLEYKDYLRMLLLLQEKVTKNYRTMSAMELRMIELGHPSFRMKNYIISAEGEAKFRCKNIQNTYSQKINITYI